VATYDRKLWAIQNNTDFGFQYTNQEHSDTDNGFVQPRQWLKTGGKDGDFCYIPDATSPGNVYGVHKMILSSVYTLEGQNGDAGTGLTFTFGFFKDSQAGDWIYGGWIPDNTGQNETTKFWFPMESMSPLASPPVNVYIQINQTVHGAVPPIGLSATVKGLPGSAPATGLSTTMQPIGG
jgi:hypothetical protein